MAVCKNCGKFIVPDPTDEESWVHEKTEDGACNPKVIDAWAEPVVYSEAESEQFKMRIVRIKPSE